MGQLYRKKDFDFGIVVYAPNPNLGHIKTTLNSLRCHYPERQVVVVIPEDTTEADLKGASVVRNGGSPAAQINAGLASAKWKEWCLLIKAGTWVRSLLDVKFSYFMESPKDIMYPVLDKIIDFPDAAWNGTLLHKQAVKELGPFPESNPETFSKLLWTIDAIDKGYKLKGIVGANVR